MPTKQTLKDHWTKKRQQPIVRLIHETTAVVHDVSSSFKAAMAETDWMSLVVEQQWVRADRLCDTELGAKLVRSIGDTMRRS